MNFLAPGRLALLLVVLALAGVYLWVQRRRRHAAVRFTNLSLLAEIAPPKAGWRRHLPAAAVALALAALVVSIAERALDVLSADGMQVLVRPASLVNYDTTWWQPLRGDATYTYRHLKVSLRSLALVTWFRMRGVRA